jgi:UDP-N-acetylglucosamine transferase subunit ALG13
MGTIIGALARCKPLLILARRAHLKEQRNDHQHATAQRFGTKPGITVAADSDEIPTCLDRLLASGQGGTGQIAQFAQDRLIAAVRAMIF